MHSAYGSDDAYGRDHGYAGSVTYGPGGGRAHGVTPGYDQGSPYGPGGGYVTGGAYAAGGYGPEDTYAPGSDEADGGYAPGTYRADGGYGPDNAPGVAYGAPGNFAGRGPARRAAPRPGHSGPRPVIQGRPLPPPARPAAPSGAPRRPGRPMPSPGWVGAPGPQQVPPGGFADQPEPPAGQSPGPAEHSRPAERTEQPAKPGTALALRNEPPPKPKATEPEADLAEFAKDLRDLRTGAGLGYPEMAELSHYTMKTLASAAGGLTLPTLPVMAAYVRACDGNVAEWEDRWHRLADTVEPAGKGTTAEPGAAADGAAGPGTAKPGRSGDDGTGQGSRRRPRTGARAPGPARGTRRDRTRRRREHPAGARRRGPRRFPPRVRPGRAHPTRIPSRPARRAPGRIRCTSSRRLLPGAPTGEARVRLPRAAGPDEAVMVRP